MENVQSQTDYPRDVTFEQVWAILERTAKRQEEFDQQLKKSKEDFDWQVKEYNKRFGDFTNRYGEMVECLVAPNLLEKLSEMGYDFQEAHRNTEIKDKKHQIFLQIDVLLENGDKAMLVEVKTELETKDVKKHVERLEKMRTYADFRGDTRRFLGAVAGIVIQPEAKEYAMEQGFYVFEPSGETFNIILPEGEAREW
jgi:hypothetical protein